MLFGFVARAAGKSSAVDTTLILALRNAAGTPIGPSWLPEAARDITSLGSVIVLVLITFAVAGFVFLTGKSAVAWLMLVAVLGGLALNNLLKSAIARPRPDLVAPAARVFTTSFPSGHATLSATAYFTIAALLARTYPSFPLVFYFVSLAAFLTGLIGLSRVYLGVHYPTDVLGGWCVGAAWATGWWALMAWLHD